MTQNEELNWMEYESITQYIYGMLGEQYGIKVIGYGRNFKVKGKSGVSHQVDVLTEQIDGDKVRRTAIECKLLKKKVIKDAVMKLHGTMMDAGIESGIIVSKTGFTKDTLMYAEHMDIKLVELREALDKDKDFNRTFEVGSLEIHTDITVTRPKITQIDFGTKVIKDEKEIMAMYYAKLHDANDNETPFSKCIVVFSDRLHDSEVLWKNMTVNIRSDRQLFWKSQGKEIAIEKIEITGFLSKTDESSTKSFRLTDQVWMIMKELFDGRNLTLSKSGFIWNLPT